MSKPKHHSFRPGVLQLESREVPSVTSVSLAGGVVTARTDNAPSTVLVVSNASFVQVQDVMFNHSWTFARSQVSRVDLFGGTGADTFTGRGDIRIRMYGGGGNDTMYGGSGRDIMLGGAGDDNLFGRNGNDYLDGGGGNDNLNGGNQDDVLLGNVGDDQLNGGLGNDSLFGDDGNDVLVSIDGSTGDSVDGGGGFDVIWVDQNGATTDLQTGIDAIDVVNAVTGFSNPGADRTLNGDRISDPALLPQTFPNPPDRYEQFSNRPLFAPQGPTIQDFSQGALGDCWFLAALGSTVRVDPNIIRSRVVDFGDGTYGVRYETPDGTKYFRVDNDLAVKNAGNTFLQYTATGVDNSMWVPIMEKAFTYVRVPGANSYASIEGGFSFDAFPVLGLDPQRVWLDPTDPALQDPANLAAYAQLITDTVKTIVDNNEAGTLGIDNVFFPGSILITSHQYVIMGYQMDALTGFLSSITLRNPWGIDGPGSSPGPGNDANFNDGIVTISFAELINVQGSFEWAPVTT